MLLLTLFACTPKDTGTDTEADADTDTDTDTDTDSDTDSDTDTDSDADADADADTDADATWTADIWPIHRASCMDCHDAWGDDQETVYQSLMTLEEDGYTFVAPGDPSQSLYYLKVTEPPQGQIMPLQLVYVPQPQIDALRTWISNGALNDQEFRDTMYEIYNRWACDDCHSEWADRGDYDALYASVMAQTGFGYPFIDPGNPDNSYMVLKIESNTPPSGSRMPILIDPLTPGQVTAIDSWITAGALEN